MLSHQSELPTGLSESGRGRVVLISRDQLCSHLSDTSGSLEPRLSCTSVQCVQWQRQEQTVGCWGALGADITSVCLQSEVTGTPLMVSVRGSSHWSQRARADSVNQLI